MQDVIGMTYDAALCHPDKHNVIHILCQPDELWTGRISEKYDYIVAHGNSNA